MIKDANHTGTMNNVNLYPVNHVVFSPFSTSGQFTLGMPGNVTLIAIVDDICDGSTITVQVKMNSAILCSAVSNGWNPTTKSIYLPAGTYDYTVFTAGCGGAFNYQISCTTGYEFAYNKYDFQNRLIETGEYQSSSTTHFTQDSANVAGFPSSGTLVMKKLYYDTPSTDPLAAGQRNLKGRVSYAESYRLGTIASKYFYSYDEIGRVEWIVISYLGSSSKKLTYNYDFQAT